MGGTIILGLHMEAFLMIVSGIFYILCAASLWRSYRREKNELIGALLAFLLYQAVNMFFMGLEVQTMNIFYGNVASLAVFVGSAYMLKFPFSSLSQGKRRVLFLLILAAVLGLFVWFMQTEERQMKLMEFTLWYDIVINGLVVGGFMLLLAIRTTERLLRIKAFGGGAGVVSCCVVANGAMLGGAILAGSVIGFFAPVIILGSLLFTRGRQQPTMNRV